MWLVSLSDCCLCSLQVMAFTQMMIQYAKALLPWHIHSNTQNLFSSVPSESAWIHKEQKKIHLQVEGTNENFQIFITKMQKRTLTASVEIFLREAEPAVASHKSQQI